MFSDERDIYPMYLHMVLITQWATVQPLGVVPKDPRVVPSDQTIVAHVMARYGYSRLPALPTVDYRGCGIDGDSHC